MENQYYTDIATQYGRLVRIIFFDFDPVTTSAQISGLIAQIAYQQRDISTSENKTELIYQDEEELY